MLNLYKKKLKIKINFDKIFNRKVLNEKIEQNLSDHWRFRCSNNPKLYNLSKFRLDSIKYEENCLEFNLGS